MARGRKTGGRIKGTPNKHRKSDDVEAFARSIIEDSIYQANLLQRAQDGCLAPPVETMLFAYAYGKPTERSQDDQAFMEALLATVLKHVGSATARQEIRAVIEAHTVGGSSLRAVA